MKQLIGYAVAALGLIASQAAAAPVTYYVQSEPYTAITNSTACPVGVCKAYGAGQRLSGTITFFGPLDPDLDVQTDDVGHMIDDFQLSDGQNTYTLLNAGVPDPNMVINFANVSTDASGVVTAFEFRAHRTTDVFFGQIAFPASEAAAVLSGWADYMRSAPEELTSAAAFANPFAGGPNAPVEIHLAFDGEDPQRAAAAIDPIRRLGTVDG